MQGNVPHIGEKQRLNVTIRGAVQGVGFRPFVYSLALELGLAGWVRNSSQGVFIEVEGDNEALGVFRTRLEADKPAHSSIQSIQASLGKPSGHKSFFIVESDGEGEVSTLVLPDLATCPECLGEILDPSNRRYLYPFTNCTHCGPRFSIIEALPYDRANTSMRSFEMCDECLREYSDPADRRFHAQPTACPVCGPHLELWSKTGREVARHQTALMTAAEILRSGGIVAVKGIGGFHLMVDARNDRAVRALRIRKRREEKPLALMYPSVERIRRDCVVSHLEQQLLESPAAPIVLLERNEDASIAPSTAPGNPYIGAMLPYSPLHHLLMRELGFPVVATSGNLSDEPMCTDEREALRRLQGIADVFLIHNRPIVRHVDDSIVRVIKDREMVVRRARGYAPFPVCKGDGRTRLCVGAHLKNTVVLSTPHNVFISQHIGDMESLEALQAFERVCFDFRRLFSAIPEEVVSDMHPDYGSTKFAANLKVPHILVQHHYAHIASCMAEHELEGDVLGVAWDGTGLGTDRTIWGGEFLIASEQSFKRFGTFRRFRLPGGELAVREPRRSALGVLIEMQGFSHSDLLSMCSFEETDLISLLSMLRMGFNSPYTSSIGRLFDAVASISGLRQKSAFEGQAAMDLEYAIGKTKVDESYPFEIEIDDMSGLHVVDWRRMIKGILTDVLMECAPVGTVSAKFHNTLVQVIGRIADLAGRSRVVLSGGCFQNKYLLEETIRHLERRNYRVYWHQKVPTNDGGIALGQHYAAAGARKGAADSRIDQVENFHHVADS